MKATIVPAQITTVEDRIAGNLGFLQLMLLAMPIFGGSILYLLLPPVMGFSLYKIIIIVVLMIFCGILAIRIKGKIILIWAVTLLRYAIRPRLYNFNKNTNNYREDYPETITEVLSTHHKVKRKIQISAPKLELIETVKAYATINNPARNIRYETTRRGGLSVRITEIK